MSQGDIEEARFFVDAIARKRNGTGEDGAAGVEEERKLRLLAWKEVGVDVVLTRKSRSQKHSSERDHSIEQEKQATV